MRKLMHRHILACTMTVLVCNHTTFAEPLGTTFGYQGFLQRNGQPVNGTCSFRFRLYDAPGDGNRIGSERVVNDLLITNGRITVQLDFGASAFDGFRRWLEIDVKCNADTEFTTLGPRQEVTAVPYALQTRGLHVDEDGVVRVGGLQVEGTVNATAYLVDGSPLPVETFWKSSGTSIYYDGGGVGLGIQNPLARLHIRTADLGVDSSMLVRNPAIAVEATDAQLHLISDGDGTYGSAIILREVVRDKTNAWVIRRTTGAGSSLEVSHDQGNVLWLEADGNVGIGTQSPKAKLHVDGKLMADGRIDVNGLRTLLGTNPDYPDSPNVIGGYRGNSVSLDVSGATIGGGGVTALANEVRDSFGTIGGGRNNTASGFASTIGGGRDNRATSNDATVAGGRDNTAGSVGTVAGGSDNSASLAATVGGGVGNAASRLYATVAGGLDNAASNEYGTVGGGQENAASGYQSTVAGGHLNTASGGRSAVGGGEENTASGGRASIPGGWNNHAGGDYSFAGGWRAVVRDGAAAGDRDGDEGTFVWSDGSRTLTSTGPRQFLIRATGGVGIGTNQPVNQLTVNGNANFTGNVGIGTPVPLQALHVAGNILVSGSCMGCSDLRFKKDVRPLTDALEKVSRLRGVAFAWKRKEYPEHRFPDAGQVGFIAQEVEAVVPEVVQRDEAGNYGVDYGRLTPLLVEATKELDDRTRTRLNHLEAQIDAERRSTQSLRAEVAQLKRIVAELAGPSGASRRLQHDSEPTCRREPAAQP